jgi:UDP-N-acetylglucosamine kinase
VIDESRYELPHAERHRLFRDVIEPLLFDGAVAVMNPVAVLLGGQPGAGKTRASEEVLLEYPSAAPLPLGVDELRAFHPAYAELLSDDPANMTRATNATAGEWMRMAIDHARRHRYSVLIEGTFRRATVTLAEAAAFHGAGYTTRIVALSVPAAVSRNSILHRAVTDARLGGDARWTPLEAHERGYVGTPQTIATAETSDAVDRITICNRAGQTLYDENRGPGGGRLDGAAQAVEIGRLNPPTPALARGWLDDLHDDLAHARLAGLLQADLLPLLEQLLSDARTMAGHAFTRRAGPDYAAALDRIATEDRLLAADRIRLTARGSSL